MGFFKDLKEDFSDAVDELIPGGKADDDEFKKKKIFLLQRKIRM